MDRHVQEVNRLNGLKVEIISTKQAYSAPEQPSGTMLVFISVLSVSASFDEGFRFLALGASF